LGSDRLAAAAIAGADRIVPGLTGAPINGPSSQR